MPQLYSFRDPSGHVEVACDRVTRYVSKENAPFVLELLKLPLIQNMTEQGQLTKSNKIDLNENNGLTIEHEPIYFPSYPYEWPAEMLHAAGKLTIKLARELQNAHLGLKDATPYNVLFNGSQPIFIDLLSIERRDPQDYIWLPYAQFMRTFLCPLLGNLKLHLSLSSVFLSSREGIESDELYQIAKGWNLLKPVFLSQITLPHLLSKKKTNSKLYSTQRHTHPEKAAFILELLWNRLNKILNKLSPPKRNSSWGNYLITEQSYTEEQFKTKEEIVKNFLNIASPKYVLDIGCNWGHFTQLAAQSAKQVVAIDIDPIVVGRLWQVAKEKNLCILPLVVNIARPSPSFGWEYSEQLSFLQRAEGKFDLVMMLAVLHHLLVQERIPMERIAALVKRLTTKNLLIEFVRKEDPMFQRIARGRDHLYTHITPEYFEQVFGQHFIIKQKSPIADSHRILYFMERK